MNLTKEQQEIYDGKQGATLAKVMQTLVRYGEAVSRSHPAWST